ncbi:MAG: hypothetical protein II894_04215 [Bacteroidales bacterium]|nr:hypothetical protein [Bacteroidales bacterium]
MEKNALGLLNSDRAAALRLLTDYTAKSCNTAVEKAWDTGDYIWTKFDGAW